MCREVEDKIRKLEEDKQLTANDKDQKKLEIERRIKERTD